MFWGDLEQSHYKPLRHDISTKYLIVGGGIAGLSAAYFLLKKGERDITLIERHTVGSGSTGTSAGMLVCEPETATWAELIDRYGHSTVRHFWEAQLEGIAMVKHIVKKEQLQCDLHEPGLLILADTPWARMQTHQEFNAHTRMHIPTKLLREDVLQKELHSKRFNLAEHLHIGVSVNPLVFAHGLAAYLKKHGVQIHEHTELISHTKQLAQTDSASITYDTCLLCRGTNERHQKLVNYLSTICVTKPLSDSVLRKLNMLDQDMFYDHQIRSYHYGKITGDKRLLVGYGDVKFRSPYPASYVHKPHVRNIKRFLARTFPDIQLPIERCWSSGYAISTTDLPVIDFKKHTVCINGAGSQVTTIAASLYAVEKLLKKTHPLDRLFQ